MWWGQLDCTFSEIPTKLVRYFLGTDFSKNLPEISCFSPNWCRKLYLKAVKCTEMKAVKLLCHTRHPHQNIQKPY